MRYSYNTIIVLSFITLLCSCMERNEAFLFTKLSPDKTGVTFENTITESMELNLLNYPFMYNGGGVAIGDINNDRLPDIFLGGNMVSSRLYLNKGNMQFVDITETAGVETDRWVSGVSMVDINNDGYLDIYLSVVSPEDATPEDRANLLFINNGNNTFTESASKYGINDTSHTTHATFLDYNRDGLLDLFLLNHSPGSFMHDRELITRTTSPRNFASSQDRLYQNNGDNTFIDVSREAGILKSNGYGLGVVVNDFNRDGWPDIYVSNDITPDDVLYINNRDGTFSNRAFEYLKHTSFAGMGVDASDFNNDGWPDILQVDMMPIDYKKRKVMSGGMGNYLADLRRLGYNFSYSKNALQLNKGINERGNLLFSEIGRLDNIAYTDWSWGVLFGDFDNSGFKDIIITNGFPKAIYNYDYLLNPVNTKQSGSNEVTIQKDRYKLLQNLPGIKIPNYLFRNEGNLRFTDVSEEWGFQEATYAYGVAHADLDNNGSLDLVVNNIDEVASIYQNNTSELRGNHFLMVDLQGDIFNKQGIGVRLILTAGGQKQYSYHTLWRGYQSTVGGKVHFGLGQVRQVDSLEVIWPDGQYQLLTDLAVDKIVTVDYDNAVENSPAQIGIKKERQKFTDITGETGLEFKHEENNFNDFKMQFLLPYQLSRLGPKLAVGDVTGNGLDDVYIGGAAGFTGKLFLQDEQGNFHYSSVQQPWEVDKHAEDLGALFFDANGDDKLDLYVASGGYEFSPGSKILQDRLYINTGKGAFVKDESALPEMLTSTSEISAGDFNADGLPDLFVGGRLVPGKYPVSARSYILENEGGNFSDVTNDMAPELVESGMITDAVWIDFDNNGQLDLVTAGIWLPIQFYKNKNGKFSDVTADMGLASLRGWWYSLEKGDFNEDNHPDLVAGNLGLNSTFTTSDKKKFGTFVHDFNNDMSMDVIFTIKEEDKYYPFFGKLKLGRVFNFLNYKFPTFKSFANASIHDIFRPFELKEALYYQVDTFASMFLQNKGDGTFKASKLPAESQLLPVKAIVVHDIDRDNNLDIIGAGNIFKTDPDIPRMDAGNGIWMKGNGKGTLQSIPAFKSGFRAPGDVRDLKLINTPAGNAVLVANNSDSLQMFLIRK